MGERIRVVMYAKPGCHLCEEAERVLATVECADLFDLEIVNIEQDEELRRQYGERVPVIVIGGITAFTYRVDPREFCRTVRRLSRQAR